MTIPQQELISVTFVAQDVTPGNYNFNVEYKVGGMTGEGLPKDLTPDDATIGAKTIGVTVVSELTGTQAISAVAEPSKNGTPAKAADLTAPTGVKINSLTWYSVADGDTETPFTGTKFAGDTKYKAYINVSADTGYQFASSVDFTVGGENDWTAAKSGDSYDLSKTFDKTAGKETPTCNAPTGVAATYGQTLSEIALTNPAGNTDGTWSWMNSTQSVGNAGSQTHKAKFTPTDMDNYLTVENIDITVTVSAKALSDVAISAIDDQCYTGSKITPAITVTGDSGKTLVKDTDYTVEYGTNTAVGSNAGSVTVKAVSGGNYSFSDVVKNFNIVAAASTISVTGDPDKEYDGSAATDPAVSKTGSTGTVTFTYYTNAECTTTTSTSNGAASDGAAPKNAGSYWVKATVAADANYGSATSAAKAFTISPKSINGANITLGTIPTYDNGTEKQVTISSVIVDGLTLTTGDYDIFTGTDKNTNVASKDLKITGKGNFTGEATKSWSLEKATPVAGDFTITTDLTKNYTGNPITVTVPTSSKNGIGSRSVYYEGTGSTTYTKSETAPTNVGTYAVTFNVSEGTNYTAASGLNIGTLTINKVDYTGDKTASGTVRSGQITADKTLTLPALPDGASYAFSGTLGGSDISLITAHSISGTTLTYSTASKAGGTSATITINVTGATNYNTYDVVVTITAEDKTELTISGVTMGESSYEYGGTPVSYNNEGLSVTCSTPFTFDNNTLEYIYSSTPDDGTTFTASTTAPTKAGSYTLTVRVPADNAAYTGEQVINFTISKKSVTITSLGASDKEYNGNDTATPTGTAVIDGKLEGDDVTIGTGGSAKFADKTVGTGKTVTFTGYDLSGTDAANYSLSGQPASVTANITAKSVTITGVTATNRAYAVGNTTVALTGGTVDGVVSGDTVTVDLSGATGMMENANVGNGKAVTVTGAALGGADAANYILSAQPTGVTVDISKAAAQTLADIPVQQKYTVTTEQTKVIGNAGMPADAGTLTYAKGTESKTGTVTISSWSVNPSTGDVKFTLTGGTATDTVTLPVQITSTNYADSTVNVKITLTAKDPQATLTINSGTTVTYGQTLTLSTTGGSGSGSVTYEIVAGGTGTASITDDVLTPTQAGTVQVKAVKAADANYNQAESATVEITINKATPTGTPTYTAITTTGKTLAEAALLPGTITPAGGTIAWDLGDSQTVSANTAYNWTYTPKAEDLANYNTLTGSITPYVVSYGGGGGGGSATPTSTPAAQLEKQLKDAKPGDTLTVDMKGVTKVSADMIADIAGKDITVEFNMGGGITWVVNGMDVPSGGLTLNLGVNTNANSIPVTAINNITGEAKTIQLNLSHNGPFGMTLTLSVDLGKENDGFFANLYYYNPGTGKLEFQSASKIAGGKAAWPFDHASSYAVVIDEQSHAPFEDVALESYYYDAVMWAVRNDVTSGTTAATFSPSATCTRAQAVTFLWRAAGSPAPKSSVNPFTDVAEGSYCYDAVLWAVENGITNGTSDTTFSPNATCSRAQIVTFLWRAQKSPAADSVNPFTDVAADAYYNNAVLWAAENGITGGTSATTFSPANDCTRAQIVTFLYRSVK